jgi:hypothetical protein
MFIKDFTRGVALGVLLLALVVPNITIKLKNSSPQTAVAAGNSGVANRISQNIKFKEDQREEILKAYLKAKNSPLAEYAVVFIDVADKYNLDWKFLPAIAGIESSFARHQLKDSHNPFGWGGGYIYFDSYEEAIWTVGEGLHKFKSEYGLDTPQKLAPTYTPPNYINWTGAVEQFMNELNAVAI